MRVCLRCDNALPRLLLESFVSSQKYSVQKALARRFRRFLTLKQDFNTLTLTTLQARARLLATPTLMMMMMMMMYQQS